MTTLQPLRYVFHLGGEALVVREVRGREALSAPFYFELRMVVSSDLGLDADALVKSEAVLELAREGGDSRRITGIVSDISLQYTYGAEPELAVVFEPRLVLTRYRSDIRVFREMTAPQIALQVLAGLGVATDSRLIDDYPVRHYCVQFRETDFHFVHRMLEEEGIFYFFREDGVMVLGDSVRAYDTVPGAPLAVLQPAGVSRHARALYRPGERSATSVSRVTLRDWNPETPSLDMDVQAAGPCARGVEQYDYPGEYEAPAQGQRIAQLMAESHACAAGYLVARASCELLAPGRTVALDGGHYAPLPDDFQTKQVVRTLDHDWDRLREDFSVEVTTLAEDTVYRPRRVHHEPIIPNPLTGFVTGASGEDIHTDAYGRVKIHFPWDRLQPRDDRCSYWVPVVQDNTGQSSAVPRVGWEMLVHYLEGDPDRPVVLGRVYNAEDKFPGLLPRDKRHTRLRSLSSPTRDGYNEIRMDDETGRESLKFHAERDQNIVVANDRTEDVLKNVVMTIDRDETMMVGGNQDVTIERKSDAAIQLNEAITVGADRERTVGQTDNATIAGNRALTIGGKHVIKAGMQDLTTVNQDLNEMIASAHIEGSLAGNSTDASMVQTLTVGAAVIEIMRTNKGEDAIRARAETIGGLVFTKAGEEIKITAGEKRITTVGGLMSINAVEPLGVSAQETVTKTSAMQSYAASNSITLKVKETSVVFKDGVLHLNAPKTISVKIENQNEQGSEESYQI